jgi:hypothetical protein
VGLRRPGRVRHRRERCGTGARYAHHAPREEGPKGVSRPRPPAPGHQDLQRSHRRSDPPGRRGRLDQRGLGAVEPAALGHQRRAIQRVLSPRRAQLRRPLAAAPLQSRGGDRIYRPAVRALKQAFRPLSPGPQRADQALCAAGLHYR